MRGLVVGLALLSAVGAHAELKKVRLTQFANPKDYLGLYALINAQIGTNFTKSDFALGESTMLRNLQFIHLLQLKAGQPVENSSIRVWIGPDGGMQVAEAFVTKFDQKSRGIRPSLLPFLQASYLRDLAIIQQQESTVREALAQHADSQVGALTFEDRWKDDDFQRVFRGFAKRGTHVVRYSHSQRAIVGHDYIPFARMELPAIDAVGFKFYEENDDDLTQKTPAVPIVLKYLNATTVAQATDPFSAITNHPWSLSTNMDNKFVFPGLPLPPGAWTTQGLQTQATQAENAIVKTPNDMGSAHGLVLDGRYVDVTVHADARAKAKNINFDWTYSSYYAVVPAVLADGPALKIATYYRAKGFKSADDFKAPPVRDPQHDIAKYMTQTTDEVQVYWAVTEMIDQLKSRGFTDPELSTRKFTAILYNPDPSFKDNAFYANDTINFTTYSPNRANIARDNLSIWHEMGHGIVDRLAGMNNIVTAKGGGFHEGIADFFAEVIYQATSFKQDFPGRTKQRIYNQTVFNMNNESHDDGEAFGAVMKSILDRAIDQWGEAGVNKTADLLLEALRFTRNHPALEESEWFEKLRYADSRVSTIRQVGEFAPLINAALVGRNYADKASDQAGVTISINNQVAPNTFGAGSYKAPINQAIQFNVSVQVKDGVSYQFRYPLRVVLSVPGASGVTPILWSGATADQEVLINDAQAPAQFALNSTGTCVIRNTPYGCGQRLLVSVYSAGETKPIARQYVAVEFRDPTPTTRTTVLDTEL